MKHLRKFKINEGILSDDEIVIFNKNLEKWKNTPIEELSWDRYVPDIDDCPNLVEYLDKFFDHFSIGGRNGTVFIRSIGDIPSSFEDEILNIEDLKNSDMDETQLMLLIKAFEEIFEYEIGGFKWDW